jgi:hypothetical protein
VDGFEPSKSFEQQIYSLLRITFFAALTFEDEERLELSTFGLTSHRSAIELFIHYLFE